MQPVLFSSLLASFAVLRKEFYTVRGLVKNNHIDMQELKSVYTYRDLSLLFGRRAFA